ncbi:MAG: retroviral-like aspartic protease family protein [Rhodobacteraceae bacterium]|nr:retroviral-like aspartic protease family protein [Paracoccaceae bacterium]
MAAATTDQFNEFKAVWDTGAINTVISQKVINENRLNRIDQVINHTANGERIADVYLVDLILPNDEIGFHSLRVTDADMTSTDVLIGMDIICSGDFAISNKNDKTIFSYQYPSTHTTDFDMENRRIRGYKNPSQQQKRTRK